MLLPFDDRGPASDGRPDTGCEFADLRSMRRIADLYPSEAKTDAKDARVIADSERRRVAGLQPSVISLIAWCGPELMIGCFGRVWDPILVLYREGPSGRLRAHWLRWGH